MTTNKEVISIGDQTLRLYHLLLLPISSLLSRRKENSLNKLNKNKEENIMSKAQVLQNQKKALQQIFKKK